MMITAKAKLGIRLILWALVVAAIIALVWVGAAYVHSNGVAKETAADRGTIIQSTGAITKEVGTAKADEAATDKVINEGRSSYEHDKKELRRTSQSAVAWADQPVDGGMRELAHARRLARDGPGADGAGRGDIR